MYLLKKLLKICCEKQQLVDDFYIDKKTGKKIHYQFCANCATRFD